MKLSSTLLAVPVLVVAWLSPTVHGAGLQSGPNVGNTYAGGMFYDANNEVIYATGISYDKLFEQGGNNGEASANSNCFVVGIDVDDWDWDDAALLGENAALDSCSAIGLVAPSALIVGGTSEGPKGMYSDSNAAMSGFAMIVDRNDLSIRLNGMTLSTASTSQVPYPQWMASINNEVYIISLVSVDSAETDIDDMLPSGTTVGQAQFPNWIETPKYGTSVVMGLVKLTVQQDMFMGTPSGQMSLQEEWVKTYPIDTEGGGVTPRVYIGGAIVKNEAFLIVAGSTRGFGNAYGDAEQGLHDKDGYVTVMDAATGQLAQGLTANNRRIGTTEDDVLTGICDDPVDPDAFYIVGSTKGDMGGSQSPSVVAGSYQGWIRKMRLSTLGPVWTRQWGATKNTDVTNTVALGCAVVDDVVYVAGEVHGGAEVIDQANTLPSQGGDDIWAAQLTTEDGNVNWIKQIGTTGNEHLSENGGVIADVYGNVVLYGDTDGSLYRTRGADETGVDVFIMVLDQEDGSHANAGAPVAPPDTPDRTTPPASAPTLKPHSFNPVGVQREGPLFAGGLVYDHRSNHAFISGAAYGESDNSNCFLATLNMDTNMIETPEEYGTAETDEACSAIAYSNMDGFAYVAGGTEEDGYMLDTLSDPADANQDTVQYGMILQVDDKSLVRGGTIDQDNPVQYPVAIVADHTDNIVYVASTAAHNTDQRPFVSNDDYPDLTSGGSFYYGSEYFTVVQGYRTTAPGNTDPLQRTMEEVWSNSWSTTSNSVFTSGMTLTGLGDTLIVVGSTKGSGGPLGVNTGEDTDDMDGFILKLDPRNGQLLNKGGHKSSSRLNSANGKDDWVTNVCNDRYDNEAFYVVGTSEGKVQGLSDDEQPPAGTSHGFICKVDTATLEAKWLKHFTMTSSDNTVAQGTAMGCSVTPQGSDNVVYVAGVVEGGAVVDGADVSHSFGKDDIFVVQMRGSDGEVNWIRQIGTPENDRLAHGGGVDIDAQGNAIILAETTGNFYRERAINDDPSAPDLLVLSLNMVDGSYKAKTGGPDTPTPAPHAQPTPPVSQPTPPPHPSPTSAPHIGNPPPKSSSSQSNGAVFAVVAVVLTLLALCFYCFGRRQARKKAEAQQSRIFAYLQQFDVEDIDLRKSPPGGWHGTYLNKLAYGVNPGENGENAPNGNGTEQVTYEMAPLTHSSVVRDSLFVDTASSPSLGFRDQAEVEGLDSYDNLGTQDSALEGKEVI